MSIQNGSHLLNAAISAAFLGACAATPQLPVAPAELRPPQGEELTLVALATGVQIYECAAAAGSATGYQWKFKGPEADLFDRGGRKIGHHYGGPTWESPDGSKVVGELRTQAPSPDATAIPHLLLKSKSNSGVGMFGSVKSIQRLETAGGRAPAEPCARASDVARVPYKATYYFYAAQR